MTDDYRALKKCRADVVWKCATVIEGELRNIGFQDLSNRWI